MAKDPFTGLSDINSISIFTAYLSLREEIDTLCTKLEETHKNHITCVPGCHTCCVDFSIFPVEYYSIFRELAPGKTNINQEVSEGECLFLVKGLCAIYHSRPLICRTHGLPLLFMGEDDWQFSCCELNFPDENISDFNESNTFPQDLFNSRLFMINKEFINSLKGDCYSDLELIPLKDLALKAQSLEQRAQSDQ